MCKRMKLICICTTALTGLFFSQPDAAILTVSKSAADGGVYKTIQGAVDAAKAKDTVLIIDSGIYEECVSIVSKKDLTIRSAQSLPVKPTISFQDKVNIGPTTCAEANDTGAITYPKNGALRILESSNITIEGLTIDGKVAYTFGSDGIWSGATSCQWAMQSGNTSITVYGSANVIINRCEITNAFYGIYFTGFVNTLSNGRSTQPTLSTNNAAGGTGNHLITNNRIHHNSFGLFLENDHDMGIVVNHNLFYSNHHSSETFALNVKGLTSEGNNLPSGAIFFKNLQKTPVAIYNNTFYNNFLLFTSHWRPGNCYLIFNNIYGPPHIYWSAERVFQNSFMASDPVFCNRTFNCLYACQTDSAKQVREVIYIISSGEQVKIPIDTFKHYQARIMNNMGEIEGIDTTLKYDGYDARLSLIKLPGNRIVGGNNKAFPSTADVRWLEPKFKSTDPSSAEFLVPDLNNPLMHSFVPDKGWAASGVRDADGSIADLGAISSCGTPLEQIRILPAATLTDSLPKMIPFYLVSDNALSNCKIEYCRFINYGSVDSNAFGGNGKVLPQENILEVITTGTVTNGLNLIQCKINGSPKSLLCGHFELVISGINNNGIRVSSTPGFIPVRIPTEAPVFDISFNTIDSGIDKQNETIEFSLKAKPGKEKLIYRQLSLQKTDGSDVLNIHGKSIYLDSLVVSPETVLTSSIAKYIDTFTVINTPSCSALPILFKTNKDGINIYTYSTHFVKLTTATSINNHIQNIKLNRSNQRPQFVTVYNLMGKRVLTIPYSNFSISRFQSTLSKGMYIVRFLQANGKEITEAGITKFIVH